MISGLISHTPWEGRYGPRSIFGGNCLSQSNTINRFEAWIRSLNAWHWFLNSPPGNSDYIDDGWEYWSWNRERYTHTAYQGHVQFQPLFTQLIMCKEGDRKLLSCLVSPFFALNCVVLMARTSLNRTRRKQRQYCIFVPLNKIFSPQMNVCST